MDSSSSLHNQSDTKPVSLSGSSSGTHFPSVWGRTPIPLQSRTNGDIEVGGVDFQGMKVENVGADNTSTSSRHNHNDTRHATRNDMITSTHYHQHQHPPHYQTLNHHHYVQHRGLVNYSTSIRHSQSLAYHPPHPHPNELVDGHGALPPPIEMNQFMSNHQYYHEGNISHPHYSHYVHPNNYNCNDQHEHRSHLHSRHLYQQPRHNHSGHPSFSNYYRDHTHGTYDTIRHPSRASSVGQPFPQQHMPLPPAFVRASDVSNDTTRHPFHVSSGRFNPPQQMPQPPPSRLPPSTRSHRSNVEAPSRDLNASLSGPVDTFESDELKDSIPTDFPGLKDYALVACEVVSNGEDVGYMKDFNKDEWNSLYGVNGMVHKHLPLATTKHNFTEKSVRRSGKKHSNFHYETKLRLTCKASNCPCESLVCRVQIGSTKGILYYEKIDVQSGKRYRHRNHRDHLIKNSIGYH